MTYREKQAGGRITQTPTAATEIFQSETALISTVSGALATFAATLDGNRIYTLQNAAMTLAGLEVAQTFTAAQTIAAVTNPGLLVTGGDISGKNAGAAASESIRSSLYSSGASTVPQITLQRSLSNVLDGLTTTTDGIYLGQFQAYGVNTTPAFAASARIRFVQDGAAGAQVPSKIEFSTATATASPVQRLTIASTLTTIATPANITVTDAATTTSTTVLTNDHTSSGTPGAGFGSTRVFKLKSSTTASQDAATIAVDWVVATHASRTARMILSVCDSAGTREGLRIEASGTAAMIGLYGVAAVLRAAAYTQTYSTASRTVPNMTAAAVTDTNGTAGFLAAADRTALVNQINALEADVLALYKIVNSLIDDLQAIGIAQ